MLLMDREMFCNTLFNSDQYELRKILYNVVRYRLNDTLIQEIGELWQRRLLWNSLPNDLWLTCWNYLSQRDYRCAATHLNRHCFNLSQSAKTCIPKTSVILTLACDEQTTHRILFSLKSPITCLTLADLLVLSPLQNDEMKFRQLVRNIECLYLTGTTIWNPNVLIARFSHMIHLRVLHFTVFPTLLRHLDDPSNAESVRNSLSCLQELQIHGERFSYNNTFDWVYLLTSLPTLQVIKLYTPVFVDTSRLLNNINSGLLELDVRNRVMFGQCVQELLRFPLLQVLNVNSTTGFDRMLFLPHLTHMHHLRRLVIGGDCHEKELRQLLALSNIKSQLQELRLNVSYRNEDSNTTILLWQLINECEQLRILHVHCMTNHHEDKFPACIDFDNLMSIRNNALLEDVHIDVNSSLQCKPDRLVMLFKDCSRLHTIKIKPTTDWWRDSFDDCFAYVRYERGGTFHTTSARQRFFQLLQESN